MTQKNLPSRMCIITRKVLPQSDLIRIVRTPNNEVQVQADEHIDGRGIYVSKKKEIIDAFFSPKKSGLWKHALKCDIRPEQKEKLYQQILQILGK